MKIVAIASLAAALGLAGAANAAVTVSYNASTAGPGVEVLDFSTMSADAGYTISPTGAAAGKGTGFRTHSTMNVASQPIANQNFYAVTPNGAATITTPDLKSITFYIGTLDTYNHITVDTNAGDTAFTGTDLFADAGGVTTTTNPNGAGNYTGAASKGYFTFTATPGSYISGLTLSSTNYSLEFNGVTAVSATPEPATWALMFAGVAMVGGALRYNRRNGLGMATAAI